MSELVWNHNMNMVQIDGQFPSDDQPPSEAKLLAVYENASYDWGMGWDAQSIENYASDFYRDETTDQEIFVLKSSTSLDGVNLIIIVELRIYSDGGDGDDYDYHFEEMTTATCNDEFDVEQNVTTVNDGDYIDLNVIPDYDPEMTFLVLAVFVNSTFNHSLQPSEQLYLSIYDLWDKDKGFLNLTQSVPSTEPLLLWMLFWPCRICESVTVGVIWEDGLIDTTDGSFTPFIAEGDRVYVPMGGPGGEEQIRLYTDGMYDSTGKFIPFIAENGVINIPYENQPNILMSDFQLPDQGPSKMEVVGIFPNDTYDWTISPEAQGYNNYFDWYEQLQDSQFFYLNDTSVDGIPLLLVVDLWYDMGSQDQGIIPHALKMTLDLFPGFGEDQGGPMFEIIGVWVNRSGHANSYDWAYDYTAQPNDNLYAYMNWFEGFIQLTDDVDGEVLLIVAEFFAQKREILGYTVMAQAGFYDQDGNAIYLEYQDGKIVNMNFGDDQQQGGPMFIALAGDSIPIFDGRFIDMGATFIGVYKLDEYNNSANTDFNNPAQTTATNYLDFIDIFSSDQGFKLKPGLTNGDRLVLVVNMTFLAPCCEKGTYEELIYGFRGEYGFGMSEDLLPITTTAGDDTLVKLDQELYYLPEGYIINLLGVFEKTGFENTTYSTNLLDYMFYNLSGVWIYLTQSTTDELILWVELGYYTCDCDSNKPPEWNHELIGFNDFYDIPENARYMVMAALIDGDQCPDCGDTSFNGLEIELWINNSYYDTILWQSRELYTPINFTHYFGTPTDGDVLNVSLFARDYCDASRNNMELG
jgi:hypothetical protein